MSELRAQWERLLPIARYHQKLQNTTNLEAWREAIRPTGGRNRKAYQTGVLLPVLTAYAAWIFSTSAVEQNWSLRKWLCAPTSPMGAHQEQQCMIICTAADGDEEQACRDAQQIWRECLPTPRAFAPRLRGRKVRREGGGARKAGL